MFFFTSPKVLLSIRAVYLGSLEMTGSGWLNMMTAISLICVCESIQTEIAALISTEGLQELCLRNTKYISHHNNLHKETKNFGCLPEYEFF